MAERGGFEPPNGKNPLTVFETAAFDRSAISPVFKKTENNIACNREKASGTMYFYVLNPFKSPENRPKDKNTVSPGGKTVPIICGNGAQPRLVSSAA